MASASSGPSTSAPRATSAQGAPPGLAESAAPAAPPAAADPNDDRGAAHLAIDDRGAARCAIGHDPPPTGGLEDRELISRMRRGDDTALHGLYQRYAGHVLALLTRIIGDRPEEAEALLLEVFLQAWRRAPEYDPQQSLPSWLFGFARARALEALRAPPHAGGRRHAQTAPAPLDQQPAQPVGRVAAVQRALAGLSDSEREALELAYYGGLSPGEIGVRLGLPADQVLLRIRQGVARLRAVRG